MRPPNTLKNEFKYWEITKDLIDQCIDIMLNLRQSGHPEALGLRHAMLQHHQVLQMGYSRHLKGLQIDLFYCRTL